MSTEHLQPSWQEVIARGGIGLALAIGVFLLFCGERGVWFSGGLLSMFGGYAVFQGIWDLRRDFGLRLARVEIGREFGAVAVKLRQDVRGLLSFAQESKDVNVAAGGIARGGATASGRGTNGFDATRPIESRVSELEKRHEQLAVALGQGEDRLVTMIRANEAGLTAERSEREAARQNVLDRMAVVMTGGLRFQIIGLVWLLCGTALTTCAPELGGFLH